MPPLIEPPWNPAYRLVPSRFPVVNLFDQVASPDEFEVIYAFQNFTNPRIRQELGDISLVPVEDRVFGEGSSPIMSAFCHINAEGSRFCDGTYGVYYGASTLEAAVAEVSYHRAQFFEATRQKAIEVDMRTYVAKVIMPLHDVRGRGYSKVHDLHDYGPGMTLGRQLREKGSAGLVYRSVRMPEAECIAAFKPKAIKVPVTQGAHVTLLWDGTSMAGWYKKSDLQTLPSLCGSRKER